MWIHVFDCHTNQGITNASFSVAAANNGNGWYYMYIYDNQDFLVWAPGYSTIGGNTDSWGEMWASLCPLPPPPSTYGNCWSG